jgi:hypothetical protein
MRARSLFAILAILALTYFATATTVAPRHDPHYDEDEALLAYQCAAPVP